MRLLLLLLFTCPCITNASSHQATFSDVGKGIDTTRYVLLQYNKHRDSFLFDSTHIAARPTDADVKKIEKIIKVSANEYNARILKNTNSKAAAGGQIFQPGKYYKQIICVTNLKGEKLVWVNCFCTSHEKRYWQKGVVMVLYGGPCFFNIKINLATNTVMEMQVNGVS